VLKQPYISNVFFIFVINFILSWFVLVLSLFLLGVRT
jgi:hypothetical protein